MPCQLVNSQIMFIYSTNKPPDPTKYDKMNQREWEECDARSSVDGYQHFRAVIFKLYSKGTFPL